MESMRRGEANTSHHQNKVALNSLGTDSNKQTNNSCNNLNNNNNKQSASIQATEIKETNFEYDDNEWDVGGIGDLLIDLDADIAKSTGTSQSSSISSTTVTTGSLSSANSSSNTNTSTPNTNQSVGGGFSSKINTTSASSATPLRQSQFSSSKSSAFTATNIIKSAAGSGGGGGGLISTTATGLSKTQSQLIIQSKHQLTGPNTIANNTKPIVPSALIAQLNSSNKKLNVPENIISLGNASNKLLQNQTSDPDRVKTLQIQTTMSSTPGGGGTGKATTKMSMDHQATLDKGLKMKIKRTKPGTKTSEAKHEIVKAEQNGTSSNLDDSNNSSSNSGSKKHSQIPAPPVVPAPTTPQATKRGNSSHRRDKTRDKTPHSQREKGDHTNSSSTQNNSDRCNCSLDLQVNGIQTPCSSLTCIRIRTTDTNNSSLGQRIIGSNNSNSNSSSISNSNSISSSNSTTGLFSTNLNTNSTQNTGGGTPNAPGPPKETTGKISSTAPSQQISNITQSQQQSLNQSSSSSSIKSQNCTNSTSISSASSLTSNSSSNSSSSNSSSIDEKCSSSPPPAKKIKCDPKDMVDMCVGTSVGTITEPDCLGPCEPGTSVTLEGIVWHETEGGVLVVNVTWRGKTYVGTLLDCTRHDWAPPRFCDSPTEELDSRTPKGRGKRGRSATILPCNDLSNFTETRSSVHSKLRNGGAKGRGGRTSTTTGTTTSTTTTTSTVTSANTITNSSSNSSNTPSSSPTAFLPPRPEKRKSKDESPSPVNGDSATQSVVNPVTGLNVQISTKKCKTASPCAVSPVLLECPEQDCSKKYKHANGLRYHQSHAHGSGSMDEDSMQPPESPQRIVPSTTPSPIPPSTPQNPIQQTNSGQPSTPTSSQSTTVGITSESITTAPCTVASTTTTTTTTAPSIIPPVNTSNINSNPTVSATIPGPTLPLQQPTPVPPQQVPQQQQPLNPLQQQQPQLQPGSIQTPLPNTSSAVSLLATVNNNSSSQNSQPPPQQLQQPPSLPVNQIPQNLSQPSPVSGAGGSITAGISGQMVQQHIMAATNPLLVNSSPSILGQAVADAALSAISSQQQQQPPQPPMNMNNGITSTPTRSDPQSKVKPGVLRFGPPPTENDRLQGNAVFDFNNLFPVAPTNTQLGSSIPSNPGPIRPSPVNALTGNTVPQQTPGTPDGVPNYNALQQSQQNLSQSSPVAAFKVKSTASLMPSQVGGPVVNSAANKPQNYGKTKKSRKSPGPGDYENATTQRAEDVQSPAYSDISDDSTPVTETEIGDKSQLIKHNDSTKKPPETTPGQIGGVGGYGMYPFYAQSPYIVPSDHQQNKPPVSQSQLSQQTPGDYSNKNKDPPLDLMNKQGNNQPNELSSQSKESGPTSQPTKLLPHFYSSYNYMNPGGYPPYNIDPNYGAVSMITDENKMNSSSQPNSMGGGVKEERSKENPSPSEHVKMSPQMMSSKLIKSEPQLSKDIKLDTMHGKDTMPQSLCGYPGMYQRHGLGVAPPPQHISRDDDIRRYYIYPEQRRSSTSSNSSSTNLQGGLKDEPPSPSQTLPPQNLNQQSSQSVGSQQSSKQSKSSNLNSSGQNVSQQQQSQKSSSLMKDQKPDDKDMLKVKQEGQKPTMETQGPPPPPTSQYYLHHSYMSPASFNFDPAHQMYRNMLVPAAPYNPSPYHLQMPRYHPPEDLSRNPNTKALDLLQHHASQYYNTHKIHELSERALKSPTSNVKVAVSSPNVSQQSNTNSNVGMQQQNTAGGGLSLQPPSSAVPPPGGGPVVGGVPLNASKPSSDKTSTEPTKDGQNNGRSPPPQRHVHTHHHTHVGLTYPMYPAPYQAAVLASQQAAAVAVINPFPPAPPTK